MVLSCFGNASGGELTSGKTLTLNNITGSFPLKGGGIVKGGPCTIPGFQPPNLPNFTIPPIPIFPGIPPFPTLCFLPPFPGLPALSLPPISISLPPLPFIPPIPLPIPGFALPFLPLLPSFDLGSLDFLCGLISIDLPVLDPFAFLNAILSKLNALISALNDFLKFCQENTEVIANTQVPDINFPTSPSPALITPNPSSISTELSLAGGLGILEPIEVGDPTSTAAAAPSTSQESVDAEAFAVAFNGANFAENDTADQLAFILAAACVIAPDPTVINQVAGLLSATQLAIDVDPTELYQLLLDNNIPGCDGFIGFTAIAIEDAVGGVSPTGGINAANAKDLIDKLVAAGLLANDSRIQEVAFDVLKGLDLTKASTLSAAILLNSSSIPFGRDGRSLARIKPIDISRAFFIKSTTLSFTPSKIVNVLVRTGVIGNVGNNISQALTQLTPLPTILTPDTIGVALAGILAGPGIDSLKAACIASVRGTSSPQALLEMDQARSKALLQSVRSLKNTTLIDELLTLTYEQFRRKLLDSGFPIMFPTSLFELIPLLSVVFEADDQVWYDFLGQFDVPSLFFDLNSLFAFIKAAAITVSSEQAALTAIKTCSTVQESDFNFDRLVTTIGNVLIKFGISLPSNQASNRDIANAIQIELGFNSINILNALGSDSMTTLDELTFRLLATGVLVQQGNILDLVDQRSIPLDAQPSLSVYGFVQSPTGVVSDIDLSSLQFTIKTKQFTTGGVVDQEYRIIENGNPTTGATVIIQVNDITQTLEIVVLRINGFVPTFEAISTVNIQAYFSTILRPEPELIPAYLISVQF